ncbi:MAG: penicillin-binding protein [Kofleriaceae bacterium]
MKRAKPKPMTPGVPHGARLRAYLMGVVVTAGLTGVAWRAWGLQVSDTDHYRELAARQHALSVDIPAPRGEVIDSHGRPLAVSADADSVWANPKEIRDVTETADKLAKLIGGNAAELEDKLAGDRRFVWIDRHVTKEIAQAVRAAKIPGIEVAREPRRWYPAKTIAGPVIGRADIDGRGLDGIELSMDDRLRGRRGAGNALRDAHGRKMFADGLAQPEPGATVQLSIDRSIQAIADAAIADSVTANKAVSGSVVVLDVATSRVLAMASFPSSDPNSTENHQGSRNRPVTDVFEAGSVMKMFTVANALEAGVVKPDTLFDVQWGMLKIGYKTIRDTHPEKYLTVSGIIKHSSNVGAVKIAMKLGRERQYAGLKSFGFGTRSGIELPGEQSGTVRDGSRWRDIEFATIAFGYGITVSPLQIAAGLAAIGNNGIYTQPRIVERVTDRDGALLYQPTPASRQVLSPANAQAMRDMLASVFEGGKDGGTAGSIVVPGFQCGGKTGTAHKYDPATKQYAEKRYLSSFAGLAPIDHPKLAIVVLVDEPSGGDYYGGKVAGPVFATVASESLRYLGVPGNTLVCPPRVPGALPSTAPKTCTVPSPKPPKPSKPAAHATVAIASEPELAGAGSEPEPDGVPDFRGMGVARALDAARQAGVSVEVTGSGRVVEQDPAPGIATSGAVKLRFSDGNSLQVRAASAPR